jgi:hypothetical protein
LRRTAVTPHARRDVREAEAYFGPQGGWNGSAFGEYGLMFMIPLASG